MERIYKIDGMAFDNSSQKRSKLISYLILSGDLILLNVVMFVCSSFRPEIKSPELTWHELYMLSSLAYLFSSGSGSVILHHRKVHAYQIVRNVSRNVLFYAFISVLIFYPGQIVDVVSRPYLTFVIILWGVLSAYRLSFRALVKSWRSSGKNLKHLVLVGSQYNMVELYKAFTVRLGVPLLTEPSE